MYGSATTAAALEDALLRHFFLKKRNGSIRTNEREAGREDSWMELQKDSSCYYNSLQMVTSSLNSFLLYKWRRESIYLYLFLNILVRVTFSGSI